MQGLNVLARRIGQKTLDGVNPFRLAAEGIQGGAEKLGQLGIVVLGSELADGREGFVALAWLDMRQMRQCQAAHYISSRGISRSALFTLNAFDRGVVS
jgi:hypothetical protein